MQKSEADVITQDQIKEYFSYDNGTGRLTWKVDRNTQKTKGKIAGWINSNGYAHIQIDGKTYLAHHVVWLLHNGELPKFCIDHINGIRADNRFENLRRATNTENQQNQRKPQSNNKSGFLGVVRFGKKWKAQIGNAGKRIHIGVYDTPESAHAAYLEKKRELHPFGTL